MPFFREEFTYNYFRKSVDLYANLYAKSLYANLYAKNLYAKQFIC